MEKNRKKRVLVVFGTRPEAIKLAQVIRDLKRSRRLSCLVCSTGQHGAMAEQVRDFFGLRVDFDLKVMRTRSLTPPPPFSGRGCSSPRAYRAMQKGVNPYGDGRAAERIRSILERAV